jgi:RNA ligase
LIDEIRSIKDIQHLVREGFRDWSRFGDVAATYHQCLVLFNYTNAAQYANRWNYFEQVSRGLILHAITGKVVARGFDKMWNFGQDGRLTTAQLEGQILNVTEKVDGSLGIAYYDAMDGKWHVATRGSFTSEQAVWATEFLRNHLDETARKFITSFYHVGTPITLLFEIIYPENRVIVNYGDLRTLILLAVRFNETGEFMTREGTEFLAEKIKLPIVPCHSGTLDSLIEWCQTAGIEQEGFIVEFVDGTRAKFKSVRYLQLAKVLSGISKSRVVQAIRDNGYYELIEIVPDEFMAQIEIWHDEAHDAFDEIRVEVERAYHQRPTDCSRKTFARWAVGMYPAIRHYLFALLDGKPIDDMIWKQVLEQVKEGVAE